MVSNERLLRDIAAVNQQLLLIARDIAHENPTQAAIQFGLDDKTIQALPNMDAGALVRLAQMPVLIFAPRIPGEIMEQALSAASNDDEDTLRVVADSIAVKQQ